MDNGKMQWFKFYGQDWMTDTKIVTMSVVDRLTYITLLCLGSSSDIPGIVTKCNEHSILQMCHYFEDPYDGVNDYSKALGFIERFSKFGMIKVTESSIEGLIDIEIVNFRKRQDRAMTNSERQSLYRERKKGESNEIVTEKLHKVTNSNEIVTLDKSRVDKNIYINTSANKFARPTFEEIKKYCSERSNDVDAQKFHDYYESNGWKVGRNSMKDWKASVRTWEKNTNQKISNQPRTFKAVK